MTYGEVETTIDIPPPPVITVTSLVPSAYVPHLSSSFLPFA